jgi:hypothetical protein
LSAFRFLFTFVIASDSEANQEGGAGTEVGQGFCTAAWIASSLCSSQ